MYMYFFTNLLKIAMFTDRIEANQEIGLKYVSKLTM